jgi:hypothetical protein
MKRLKPELGLLVNVHPGLCEDGFVSRLADSKPDAVSVDLIGADAVVREVFGLDLGADAYWHNYERLKNAGLTVVPHITIGLSGGGDSGEEGALGRLSARPPRRLVMNVLVPTGATRYSDARVDRARALKVVAKALDILPETEIIIGCMRPRGWGEFESEVAKMGVSGMVNPSRTAIDSWRALGKTVEVRTTCCALG